MGSETRQEKTKEDVENDLRSEYPQYIRDAEQIAANVTVWTWDKVDEEGMLPLREQANQLALLVERQRQEYRNVESDAHVRLGIKATELKRAYEKAARHHFEQLLQNMEYQKTRIHERVGELQEEVREQGAIQKKIKPGGTFAYHPEIKEICLLLEQTGFESRAAIHDFMQRMAERSKGQEMPLPEINVWLHRLADTLRKILFGYNALRTLPRYQKQYETQLASGGHWSGITLVEMEKQYLKLRDACFEQLQLRDVRFETSLANPLTTEELHRAQQRLATWLANAHTGEEIRYTHEFITDATAAELGKQKGAGEYCDRVIITAKKIRENEYAIFISEWLSVRAYVAQEQFKILPILRALEQEAQTRVDSAKTQLTVPKQRDAAMEFAWTNYAHVDANYRQAQIAISNLNRERLTTMIQQLFREIVQDDERLAAAPESVK